MPLPPQLRLATDALLVAAWAQLSLGVATVLGGACDEAKPGVPRLGGARCGADVGSGAAAAGSYAG